MKGNIIGVMQELKPIKNQAVNFMAVGIAQTRKLMLQNNNTVAANANGI